MTMKWQKWIGDLAEKNGYTFEFLIDRFNEVMEEDGDLDYFIGVTEEHDW